MKKLINKFFIKYLSINNWRNFDSEIVLYFDEKYNEISGKNGLGKTSILDAIDYMLFEKTYNGDFNKVQYNSDGLKKDTNPRIKLIFNFKNVDYTVETYDNKWFINGNKMETRSKYLNHLEEWIFKIDLNNLYQLTKHNFIIEKLSKSQKSSDKQEIRNYIIQILNNSTNDKIDIDKFENSVKEKTNAKEEIKEIENNIKKIKVEMNFLERNNENIKNFEDIDNLELKKRLIDIEYRISEYEKIQQEIKKCQSTIEDLKISKNKFHSQEEKNYKSSKYSRINGFLLVVLLILGIIPGLIYVILYFINKRKSKEHNQPSNEHVEIEIHNIKKEIAKEEKKCNQLLNDEFYKNVSYNDLIDERSNLKNMLVGSEKELEQNQKLRIKYNDFQNDLQELEKKKNCLKQKIVDIDNENKNVAFYTEKILKKVFPDLAISLFNKSENEDIEIKKNGVPFKYLNFASKQNIAINFSEVLNKKNISSFFLVDQGESINDIYKSDDNQIIVCKVSNNNRLTLNGKDIY